MRPMKKRPCPACPCHPRAGARPRHPGPLAERVAEQGKLVLWALVAATLAALPALAQADLDLDFRDPQRPARAALFRAPGFPTVDAPAIDDAVLDGALAGLPVEELRSVEALGEGLRLRRFDTLILPYGSAFPLDAWEVIRAFVKRGGGLVVLGGAPFHQPVRQVEGEYVLGVRQPTFAHEFLLGPAEAWSRALDEDRFGPLRQLAPRAGGWSGAAPRADTVYQLTVRLATRKDLPHEHGSEGHRDAVLRPLAQVVDERGVARACTLLEIDRLRGDDAGGRWVLAPSDAALDAETIRGLVARALAGAAELDAGPVHASVEPGEAPVVRVALRRPFVRAGEEVPERAEVRVLNDAGEEIDRQTIALRGAPESRHGLATIRGASALAPGLYRVEVTTPEAPWRPRATTTGFWVRDGDLLASAPPLTVSRDWLRRDGKVLPVMGTTYMASDVHRKFLFEPDPHVWNRDFARMADLGINFVRTGLWTAWSRAMLNPGAVDEGFLRALDAYVLSAANNGIVVNFTFFAFLPPAYGGANPYLDPRARDGQRELLTLVASRYRGVDWVHWDLINEPSYAPPEGLWSNRPIGDPHEARAWREWVLARHGDDEALLRDRWQDPEKHLLALPRPDEMGYSAIRDRRRPRKARDFALFSQDVVTGWARTLRAILRQAGGEVLVTLGQDEGGTFNRPSQQLHAEAVDYTGLHPWWRNDDLLASGVMAKVPEKPNLFQETGLMRLEDLDGWPWRSPDLAARVLESKYAYAFASRGAGVIEWAWNITPYQPIDNESVIGFFRPDGTAKPELAVVSEYAAFFAEAAPWLDDFEPDPVVAVIPHSRLLMGRPGGAEGLKRMIRMLAERFGVVPTGLSELRLTAERLRHAKLILVPSPLVLEDGAAEALLEASRAGAKVLLTGALRSNPYGERSAALDHLGIDGRARPVSLREATGWGGAGAPWATFDRDLREQVERGVGPGLGALAGDVWHEPLPLEFAREEEPLAGLLEAALAAADVDTQPSASRVAARLLHAPRATLAVLVNETALDARRVLRIGGRTYQVPVAAGRSRLLLVERGTGELLAATGGEAVESADARDLLSRRP